MEESNIRIFIFQALPMGFVRASLFSSLTQRVLYIPILPLILTSMPGIFLPLTTSYFYLSPVHLLHPSTNITTLGKLFLTNWI